MSIMRTLTINGTTYNVTPVVPASSVTLLSGAWVGDGDAYSQVVELPGVTPNTKVDLQPTADQLAEFYYKVLAFVAENDGGVVRVYAVGDKPKGDHTIQTTLTEVETTGKIRGNTVGTPMPRSNFNQTDPNKADYIVGRDKIVQTINGVPPDENGNVVVEVPESGGPGTPGADGFSPVAKVTQTENGAVVSVTDKNGTTTATITNGKDGEKGEPGEPGAAGKDGSPGAAGKDGTSVTVQSIAEMPGSGGLNVVTFSDGKTLTVRNGKDGEKGEPGNDGESVTHSWSGTKLTINSASGSSSADLKGEKGDTGAPGADGAKGDKGDKGDQGIQGESGAKGDKGDKGDTGATGQRGTGLLPVTTAPSGYTTAVGGITPKYRMAISTIKTQAGVTEVLLGDTVRYSYYHYPIAYLDASYAYFTTRVSIRGATGAEGTTPVKGTDYFTDADKAEMVEDVKAAYSADISWLDGYNIPKLYLTGDTAGMSKDVAVTLNWAYGENSGSCTLKWQGSSSLAYEKKNYTIKLDTAIEVVDGWGSQKKYCLKANYIDHTHARNVVSAKLWGKIVASRSSIHSNLKNCPNYGAVDGFPIAIVLNGEFHGLYTWNIPKDGWMFGMGSGTQEAVICADDATYPAVDLRVHSLVNGDDHELEYVTDENSTTWVATSLNRVIDALVNSYGADLDTTLASYLDWESAIDYYIFTVIMDGRDMTGKNYIMATWNGTKWVFSAYDMDSTYGLDWNGATLLPPHEGVTFESFRKNRVMELVYRFKTNALKARYKKLRETVLSEYAINQAFENFGCGIPSVLLDEDAKKWTSIPSTSVNTTDQILRWLHHRLAIVDKWVDAIPTQETPVAPSARTENAVPASVGTNGKVYNSVGYKDGYTINNASDGTETEVAMDGCCITGFIPVTKENLIKVTTDHWNISPTNSRIIFYDMDLKPMAYYTQHGFVGLFNGYTNATAIQTKDKHSVTYGSNGLVTLNIAYGASCTNLGYIRIRGVGKGANLAVIREGEIPEHDPNFEPEVVVDNWISVSTDASGNVYNGTGYKDNTRTKTDDGETEETKTGMFQTGFIPLKKTDVIRVTSSAWGTSPSNAKIVIYNAQFKAMTHYTANGYVSCFNGYTNGAESNVTSLKSKEYQSVTEGDDGFTTLNLAYGNQCTDVAYCRYTGCGSGAGAVLKLN